MCGPHSLRSSHGQTAKGVPENPRNDSSLKSQDGTQDKEGSRWAIFVQMLENMAASTSKIEDLKMAKDKGETYTEESKPLQRK